MNIETRKNLTHELKGIVYHPLGNQLGAIINYVSVLQRVLTRADENKTTIDLDAPINGLSETTLNEVLTTMLRIGQEEKYKERIIEDLLEFCEKYSLDTTIVLESAELPCITLDFSKEE